MENQDEPNQSQILSLATNAIELVNVFCEERYRIRGERIGSGMGTLFEVLWAYEMNNLLRQYSSTLLAWLGDQYNDFALVNNPTIWD